MINNRQAGRRRGRGGQQRQQGGGGRGPESGNRIDNRARGNASQLLEKYKNLASDAQRQGDRVNTEYYLQFADHYFRVLADSRSRFEEQNPSQRRPSSDDGYDDDGEFDGDGFDMQQPQQAQPRREDNRDARDRDARDRDGRDRDGRERNGRDRDQRDGEPRDRQGRDDQRGDRQPRFERRDRDDDDARGNRAAGPAADEEGERIVEDAPRGTRGLRPRRNGRPDQRGDTAGDPVTLDLAVLPPAIQLGVEGEVARAEDESAPAPRRRGRPRKIDPASEQAAE